MAPILFVIVIALTLAFRVGLSTWPIAGWPEGPQTVSVVGGIILMIMLVYQCATSSTEGARGGRRGRRGRRCRGAGCRAQRRVLFGGEGGWTGYVPWWLYPSYYYPYGGYGGYGWGPYPDPYPPGYGPNAYMPRPYFAGPCAQGCMADGTGSYGCPTPGYYPGQCRFASDCSGCAPGGVPAIAY